MLFKFFACILATTLLISNAKAELKNDIIYQIVTDRFFDGNTENNCGQNESTLNAEQKEVNNLTCDSTLTDWNKYWGGDFAGLIKKINYIKSLGVTKIWISPIIENARGFALGDGTIKTAYHGYWGRDWFRLNEHFTNKGINDFDIIKNLISTYKKEGIDIIIDTVLNHSSPAYDAEFGAVYDKGNKVTDYLDDSKNWFHKEPAIVWSLLDSQNEKLLKEYTLQHDLKMKRIKSSDVLNYLKQDVIFFKNKLLENYKLADLADFDQANIYVKEYLRRAHLNYLDLGFDGFRLDAIRHMPIEYIREFIKDVKSRNRNLTLIAEWFGGGPGNIESMQFTKNTNIPIFDFKLRDELKDLFKGKKNLTNLLNFIESSIDKETGIDSAQNLVTFLDNHDLPRLKSENFTNFELIEMYKLLFALRGVPTIYYGSEVFLNSDGPNFKDPYNRQMMKFPNDSDLPNEYGIKLIKQLSDFRKAHPSLRFGKTKILYSSSSHLYIERKFENDKIIILVHDTQSSGHSKRFEFPEEGFDEYNFVEALQRPGKWKVHYYYKKD